MSGFLTEELVVFPANYAGHLKLALGALAMGLLVSIPAGILAARQKYVAGPALATASVIQTIPGIALLALMVPLMGGMIGFWPAFVALSLYSILPMLRNTIVGLRGVDEDVREAALAVGMTARQRLREVDLPLAAPVIVAGLRTASAWVVGTATLSTPVGARSLGNYIFQGLQTRNWSAVLFGCLVSAALALALDQIIAQFEKSASERKRSHAIAGGIGLVLIILPALLVISPQRTGPTTSPSSEAAVADSSNALPLEGQTITVASKGFTEQYILADLLRRTLEAQGARVRVREGLGTTVAFDALAADSVDIYVDYTGTVWASLMNEEEPAQRADMYAQVSAWLLAEHGVLSAGKLGFENAYAFATSPETARTHDLETIGDLSGAPLSIASDPEFFGRPEWTRTRDAYGLESLSPRSMDSAFMYDAVRRGEVGLITAYTTDGRIDAFELVLLEDTRSVLPPYDAFMLIGPEARTNTALLNVLGALEGKISTELMRKANSRVDLERQSSAQAGAWLYEQIFPAE
ncbi:ABC transporter permease/substrate-binding protein [Henriciella marina]|uniref:ABC transporter permease/substrate-binding protein n=1 Tax=Henriciella marina TaxID=453851 RepID=A0ABT4LY79_9PROT|nr:ABC transporter permease/substrate-binding protein [Henriciella marina]MCZ4299338.1 ABC transporter permease/substrate-binding protein [Henriciella marina]